jgi:type IV fimbrial biogenesis protein FimT
MSVPVFLFHASLGKERHTPGKSMRQQDGITLVELLIAVAVASILAAIAIPSLGQFIRHNRLAALTNEFVANLNLARSEAVKTGYPVVICKASGGRCVDSGDWRQHWLTFEDRDRDGACADLDDDGLCDDDGGRILRYAIGSVVPDAMVGNSHVQTRIRFSSLGDTAGYSGRIWICDDMYPHLSREVVIHVTGRIRVDTGIDPCPGN